MEFKIQQSQNILNWYNFNSEDEVLEIGENDGELTELLRQKVKNVTTVIPNEQQKYDIITLIGITGRVEEIFGEFLTLEQIIKKLEKYLKDNGKFLIAVDNKFGIRYFSGNYENILNKKFASLNGYKNETKRIETFTKKTLEETFKRLGYKYNFYYPLPDYKIPDVIFSDKYLPKHNNFDKYNSYYIKNTYLVFDEIQVLREILTTNPEMFTFFANSFFIELSKNEINNKYKYIAFSNLRKEQYRIITKMTDEYVEKENINEKSIEHYNGLKNNIKIMQDLGIKTLDYIENEKVISKYTNQELMLNNVLEQKLEEGNIEKFNYIMNTYIQTLMKNTYKENDYSKTVFAKYGIEFENKDLIKELNFMREGLWDMTITNCFYIDEEMYFFDQEWNEPSIPCEYILYKSIIYTPSIKNHIDVKELLDKFNLTKYIELFNKLDEKIQEKIRDDEIFEHYKNINIINIDETVQEMENMKIREEAKDKAIANYQKSFFKRLFGGK